MACCRSRRHDTFAALGGAVVVLAAAATASAAPLAPALTPALAIQPTGSAAGQAQAEKPAAAKKAEIDEKAREVLDRAIEVQLGEHAKKKDIESVRMSGAMVMPAVGMNAEMTILMDADGNVAITQIIPGIGTIRSGVTGDVGWSLSELTGPMIMSEAEVAQTRQQADIYGELNWHERASKITYAGEASVTLPDRSTRPTHQLTVVDRETGKEETHHFDREKGTRLQSLTMQAVPGEGEIPVTTTYLDYEKIGQMMVPKRSVVVVGPQQMEMRVSEWVVNGDVPEDAFEMPAEVKAIAERG